MKLRSDLAAALLGATVGAAPLAAAAAGPPGRTTRPRETAKRLNYQVIRPRWNRADSGIFREDSPARPSYD